MEHLGPIADDGIWSLNIFSGMSSIICIRVMIPAVTEFLKYKIKVTWRPLAGCMQGLKSAA